MKISFDFDGTITKHPAFFSVLMLGLQDAGFQVGILTGHHHDQEKDDRERLEKHCMYPDFWIGRAPTTDPHTAEFKAQAIIDNKIDFHIDDCDEGREQSINVLQKLPNVICIR